MEDSMNKAFAEVYDIIRHMDKEIIDKIPKKFIKFIYDNRDNSYNVKFDYSKNILEQNMLRDTKVLLSIIYIDYVCSPEKRAELKEKDKEEIIKERKALDEKYKFDFNKINEERKNRNSNIEVAVQEAERQVNNKSLPTVVKKDSIFKRIVRIFINFIKHNN